MACVSKTNLVLAKKFFHDQGSKCNNKEYTVLEGSAGRNRYLTKTRQSNLKMENKLPWKLQPTRDGELWKNITVYMYGTCTDENSNGRRIECPLHISLLNSSQMASWYATHRQINSADGSIAACKLQKLWAPIYRSPQWTGPYGPPL